jgi:hypothetical protein
MGIDNDELKKSGPIQEIAEEAQRGAQNMISRSQVLGLMSWLLPLWLGPVGGGVAVAINEGLNQLADKRLKQRLQEMGTAMAQRLQEVGESKIDKEWFRSEEFQTMLFEAARQVAVTSDRKKILMLGNALANGGIADFSTEQRKELFLQLIHDLTPQHIAMLSRLLPPAEKTAPAPSLDARSPEGTNDILWEMRPSIPGNGEDLLVLQMLAGSGLVTESLIPPKIREPRFGGNPSQSEVSYLVSQFLKDLQKIPTRMFRLSTLGKDFLDFVSMSSTPK